MISEAAILRSGSNENRKSSSPAKEDRYFTMRGSVGGDENGKVPVDTDNGEDNKLVVWPKLYITLSNKQKEEDFLAMKVSQELWAFGFVSLFTSLWFLIVCFGFGGWQLVSPGAWLIDICQERYEVGEKKSSKKRPRGLEAMGIGECGK